MNKESLNKAMASISKKMDEKCSYLIELDQQNGDGDLGISMKEGFEAASHFLAESAEKDLGRLMMGVSGAFNEAAPSSLGTILSIGMMGMAKILRGLECADTEKTAEALLQGIENIMVKAHSKIGEKTILDAIYPASMVLKENAKEDIKTAYKLAAQAAQEGAESTKNMLSRHGRAAYYGEKSIGIIDGGAVAGKYIFEAVYESVCE